MNYTAHYKHRRNEKPEYYRTITAADSLNEAIKQADRWTRKGFLCVGVTSKP